MRVQGILPALPAADVESLATVDAVIVDLPVVSNAVPAALRQLRTASKALVVIVVYGFASRHVLARLDAANVIALSAPTDPA